MAIFDERATALPEPDLRGIRGNSDTKVSKAPLASTALEGLTNTLGVAMTTEATSAIRDFKQDASDFDSIEAQAQAGQQAQLNELVTAIPDIRDKGTALQLTRHLDSLQKARNVSPFQFQVKRNAMLAGAINDNPHLENEFRAINNTYGGTQSARSQAATAKKTFEEEEAERFLQAYNDSGASSLQVFTQARQKEFELKQQTVVSEQSLPAFNQAGTALVSLNAITLQGDLLSAYKEQGIAYDNKQAEDLIIRFQRNALKNIEDTIVTEGMFGSTADSYRNTQKDLVTSTIDDLRGYNELLTNDDLKQAQETADFSAATGFSKLLPLMDHTRSYLTSLQSLSGGSAPAYAQYSVASQLARKLSSLGDSAQEFNEKMTSAASSDLGITKGLSADTANDYLLIWDLMVRDFQSQQGNGTLNLAEPASYRIFTTWAAAQFASTSYLAVQDARSDPNTTSDEQAVFDQVEVKSFKDLSDVFNASAYVNEAGALPTPGALTTAKQINEFFKDPRVQGRVLQSPELMSASESIHETAVGRVKSELINNPDWTLVLSSPEPVEAQARGGFFKGFDSGKKSQTWVLKHKDDKFSSVDIVMDPTNGKPTTVFDSGDTESGVRWNPRTGEYFVDGRPMGTTTAFGAPDVSVPSSLQHEVNAMNMYGNLVYQWAPNNVTNSLMAGFEAVLAPETDAPQGPSGRDKLVGDLDNESYTDADEARLQELLSKQGAK